MKPLTHTEVWTLQQAIAREADRQMDEVLLPRLAAIDAERPKQRAWSELSEDDFNRSFASSRQVVIDMSLQRRLSKAEEELEFLLRWTTEESMIKLPDGVSTACFDAHIEVPK